MFREIYVLLFYAQFIVEEGDRTYKYNLQQWTWEDDFKWREWDAALASHNNFNVDSAS